MKHENDVGPSVAPHETNIALLLHLSCPLLVAFAFIVPRAAKPKLALIVSRGAHNSDHHSIPFHPPPSQVFYSLYNSPPFHPPIVSIENCIFRPLHTIYAVGRFLRTLANAGAQQHSNKKRYHFESVYNIFHTT